MKLLILFIALNIVNVIIQTFKSLATVKCGKGVASIVNAVAFGIYTVVLVYMNCDLTLWQKVIVVALTNLVGVYVVKLIEEKQKSTNTKIDFETGEVLDKEITIQNQTFDKFQLKTISVLLDGKVVLKW